MRRSLDLAGKLTQLHVLVLLLVAVAIFGSACDSGTPASPPPASPTASNSLVPPQNPAPTNQPSTKVNEVGIILNDSGILPNSLGLPAGKVQFIVTNQGNVAHDLVISNDAGVVAKTPSFTKADGNKTLDVTLQPGTYKLASDLPSDADKGMTGELDVK